MRRWLTIALSGLVLSCQGPAAVLARETTASAVGERTVPTDQMSMARSMVRD